MLSHRRQSSILELSKNYLNLETPINKKIKSLIIQPELVE